LEADVADGLSVGDGIFVFLFEGAIAQYCPNCQQQGGSKNPSLRMRGGHLWGRIREAIAPD
jgi:hypothetical protein